MSHFVVVVIGEDVERQLAPYHEFECTGRDDEFVQAIDVTEKYREDYLSRTRVMADLPNGERVSAYDDRFYREFTPEEFDLVRPMGTGCGKGLAWSSKDWGDGRGYRAKVLDPAHFGATEVVVPFSETMTFREFCSNWGAPGEVLPGQTPDTADRHKYGWVEIDAEGAVVKVIDRTNPNAKWDWWVEGGRWDGYFPVLYGARSNSCRWGDVDFDSADIKAAREARAEFAPWRRAFETYGRPESWKEVMERLGYTDEARAFWNAQPAIKHSGSWSCPVATYGFDEEAYVARQRRKALVPFAIVKDGKWYEKGEMGWWGAVSDEKDEDVWEAQVRALFEGLDPDTRVTAVDCHI